MQDGTGQRRDVAVRPNQGVVVQAAAEVPLDAYLVALSRVLEPSCVTHIARTAEGVCVFLDSASEAEDLVEDGVLEVDGVALACRPYRADSRRVRLSGCPPFLEDEAILVELRRFGQVFPPLVTEPVATAVPDFAHVLSFTKTVTMALKEHGDEVPDVVGVPYEGLRVPVRLAVEDSTAWSESCRPASSQTSADAVGKGPRPAPAPAMKHSQALSRLRSAPNARSTRSPVDAFLARHPGLALAAPPCRTPPCSPSPSRGGSRSALAAWKRRGSPISMAAADSASATSTAVVARTPRGLSVAAKSPQVGMSYKQARSPYDPGGGRPRTPARRPAPAPPQQHAVKRFVV